MKMHTKVRVAAVLMLIGCWLYLRYGDPNLNHCPIEKPWPYSAYTTDGVLLRGSNCCVHPVTDNNPACRKTQATLDWHASEPMLKTPETPCPQPPCRQYPFPGICPEDKPWAYRPNPKPPAVPLDYCCATPWKPNSADLDQNERNNSGPYNRRSGACFDANYIRCPKPPCADHPTVWDDDTRATVKTEKQLLEELFVGGGLLGFVTVTCTYSSLSLEKQSVVLALSLFAALLITHSKSDHIVSLGKVYMMQVLFVVCNWLTCVPKQTWQKWGF
eukprot:TRINITY_DN4154_c0_g1_i1.p1 TRINITY_DN4154_c0_g1~~TRINITY_DN4154_c0_g1_i1.p1  ORF type:complete len:273 (+),score=23.36 TRINITY_DN4154_c0_g1_i1:133-951(+)